MSARSIVRFVKVEGCGDVASGLCWRWSSSAYAGDDDGVYLPALLQEAWSPVSASWDPRGQGAGALSVGGVTVRLTTSERLSVLPRLYRLDRPSRLGVLHATITASATTLTIDQVSAVDHSGAAIALGREVIRLDSLTSSSGLAYTYAVTRGLYETQARAHAADAYTDTSIFPADRFPFKILRTVTLGYAPVTGTGYGDEVVVARGVLRALSVDGQGEVLSLGCDSALDLVRSRMLLAQLWRGWRTRASEPAANGTWVVDWAADFPDQRPSYKPGVGLWRVGERVLYNQWTYIVGPEGDRHPAVSAGDGTAAGPDSPSVRWEDASEAEQVWEVFTSHPAAPPLVGSGTATQQRLSQDAVALARQLLTTTKGALYASPGSNGDYDLGIEQLGCGVPESLLDTAAWDAAEDAGGPDLTAWLGLDGEPVEALDLVQRLLRAAGWTMTTTATGLLTLRRLVTASASPDHTLTGALIPDVQGQRPRFEDAADAVVVTWGLSPVGPRQRTYTDPAAAERHLAQGAQIELDLSPLQDPDEVESAAIRELVAWRYPMPQVEASVLLTAFSQALAVGDTASVTSRAIIAGDGTRGVTSSLAQILAATPDWEAARVQVTLLMVGVIQTRARRITPAALVDGVVGLVVSLEASTFSATPAPGQTDDGFGWAVGDVVRITTRDGGTVRGTATVTAVTPAAPSITLGAVPGGTVAGDLVEPADYDAASSAQRAAWAYMADSDATLGAAADEAHQWTV